MQKIANKKARVGIVTTALVIVGVLLVGAFAWLVQNQCTKQVSVSSGKQWTTVLPQEESLAQSTQSIVQGEEESLTRHTTTMTENVDATVKGQIYRIESILYFEYYSNVFSGWITNSALRDLRVWKLVGYGVYELQATDTTNVRGEMTVIEPETGLSINARMEGYDFNLTGFLDGVFKFKTNVYEVKTNSDKVTIASRPKNDAFIW